MEELRTQTEYQPANDPPSFPQVTTQKIVNRLLQILGFAGWAGTSLYKLFKKLKGRRIEKPEDVPKELDLDIPIQLLIKLYNDPEVQAQLRRALDPLHQDGIEEIQTKRQGKTIESVSKKDLLAADDGEIEDLTKDEEIDLDIEKCAWRQDLAWHFRDKDVSFDAKIDDRKFWKRIDEGEAFAGGDRLRVHLQTTARRTPFGRVKVERVIPRVIDVTHIRNRQTKLFEDDGAI